MPTTNDTAATTSTQLLTGVVAIAMEMPLSHSMWPTINPPIPATQIVLKKLIMWPMRPWKHSCSASDIVGWVCTLRASSVAVRSHFCARVSSGSSSETSWPIRCPPSSSPYFPSAISLTKPTRVAGACALPLAVNGNLATLTS